MTGVPGVKLPGEPQPSSNCASDASDPDQASVDAFCSMVSEWVWTRAPAFVAGCYFTVGAAWVWSWFL